MRRRCASLALLLLALASRVNVATAQSSDATTCRGSVERKAIGGRIVDDATGAPMVGVSAALDTRRLDMTFHREAGVSSGIAVAPGVHRSAEPDASGRFCFTDLPAGEYRFEVQAMREDASHQAIIIRLGSTDTLKTVTLRYRAFGRSPEEEQVVASMLRTLDENRQRWIRSRPRRYLLRVRYQCGLCSAGAPETYEMLDGTAIAIVDSSGARHALWGGAGAVTIESMFTTLRSKLLDENQSVEAVEYDSHFGWPRHYETGARIPVTDTGAKVTVERFDVIE